MGYLSNFIVYTLAMVGVIVLALLVFKNSTGFNSKKNSKLLKVIDTMSLSPKKTLYVISAGTEKFLIAGDIDRTTLISKLDTINTNKEITELNSTLENLFPPVSFKETMANLPQKRSYIDKKNLGIKTTQNKPYDSVMKNLAERIKN